MSGSAAVKLDHLPRMTLEEFLAWDGGGHVGKLELVEGVVRALAPASASLSLIQGNIVRLIGNHLKERGSHCRAATEAPIVPPAGRRKIARAPDVAVTCGPITDSPTFDDPVLIVELMSPNNESDSWESIEVLLGLPTMREVLVMQSTRIEAEVPRPNAKGYWPGLGLIGPGGKVHLESIDLELPIEDFYEGTHLAP